MRWSHTREVKTELCRIAWKKPEEARAELAGMWLVAGRAGRLTLGSALVARRAYGAAKAAGLAGVQTLAAGRRGAVTVILPGAETLFGRRLGSPRLVLRGAFLARGYVAAPERSYHLEIGVPDAPTAAKLRALAGRLALGALVVAGRHGIRLQIRDQEQVARFLAAVGAHQAHLALESWLVVKSMKNHVNRWVNGETANLRRAAESGVRQADWLRAVRETPRWAELPPALREVAELRLAHPEWSLAELGRALSPPVGKSGVAHRWRRLRRWAEGGPNPDDGAPTGKGV
ncbi:MAG: DNA-binding protein WhiA [Actinomycetia bacterium]|nr:DNA-binding protein WhiA [Actinomycetes bacterium]